MIYYSTMDCEMKGERDVGFVLHKYWPDMKTIIYVSSHLDTQKVIVGVVILKDKAFTSCHLR